MVEAVGDLGEREARQGILDQRARALQPREDPALLHRFRTRPGSDPGRGRNDQSRDVPELVGEAAPLVHRCVREPRVLLRRHLHQAVAGRVRPILRDDLQRVDAVPERLRHPPPVRREHRRVDDHVGERDLLDELEPGEDHPVLPEADDLSRRDVEIARVEALQVRCVVRPAERRERPERRREPRVEDVRVALELRLPALGAGVRLGLGDGDVAVGAVPDGQLVPPPELARDVPVGRVGERVDREPVLRLGVVAHAARLQSLDRRRAELVHAAPPLKRDQRLDAALAALADGDRVAVGLAPLDQAALLAPGEHPLPASS